MKKNFLLVVLALLTIFGMASTAVAEGGDTQCNTIPEGNIVYSPLHYWAGEDISTGFNDYDTNYPAHEFVGYYVNGLLAWAGFPPFNGDLESYVEQNPTIVYTHLYYLMSVRMEMHWNDAYLSNKDCDGDYVLDQPTNFTGTGAEARLHYWDTYTSEDGESCKFYEMAKIIGVPVGAYVLGEYWYGSDDNLIGEVYDIESGLAYVTLVKNDPCDGFHGHQTLPAH